MQLIKTELELEFPEGASFQQPLSIYLYRRLTGMICRICCLDRASRCETCSLKDDCQYYWLTGQNFQFYSGVLCPAGPFEKRRFRAHDTLKTTFLWVGSCSKFAPYVDLLLEEMDGQIQRSPFVIRKLVHEPVEETNVSVCSLHLITPVSFKETQSFFEEMSTYYKQNYEFDLSVPENGYSFIPGISMRGLQIKLPQGVKRLDGLLGDITFNKETNISSFWLTLGLGNGNCIGGGRVEADHSIYGSGNQTAH